MQENSTDWSVRVCAVQQTGSGKQALLRDLATYAYHYPRRRLPHLDEDTSGEFYLFCHRKLEHLVERFRERGIPFEHYLNSVLSWQLRTFLAKRNRAEQSWQAALRSPLWDCSETTVVGAAVGADTPRDTPRMRPARTGRLRMPTTARQRRLLYAVLKAGHRLDDAEIEHAAAATGCPPGCLRGLIAELARRGSASRRRQQMLRERRNHAFAELNIWSAAAQQETDPERRASAETRAARHRRTMNSAQAELARVRVAPSNREIGDLLGVPKGTVDTGLYWLKRDSLPAPGAARYPGRDGVGTGEQQSA